MQDLIQSVLSMKLDVYKQIDTQNADTGAIVKEWLFYKTVDCHAKGVVSNSATTRSSDKQIFNNKYVNDQIIQVRTENKLTTREKLCVNLVVVMEVIKKFVLFVMGLGKL